MMGYPVRGVLVALLPALFSGTLFGQERVIEAPSDSFALRGKDSFLVLSPDEAPPRNFDLLTGVGGMISEGGSPLREGYFGEVAGRAWVADDTAILIGAEVGKSVADFGRTFQVDD